MDASLQERCRLFLENRDIFRSVFKGESPYIYPICAAIVTDRGSTADPAALKQCKFILKEHTGVFSEFRGLGRTALIAMMSVDLNPRLRLNHAQQVYDHLRQCFCDSQYLCFAAMVISDLIDPGYYKPMAEHMRRIYGLLKSKRPFLTGAEDSVFSALLAVSKKTDARIVDETERCYQILRQYFQNSNSVQSLSHVLALCEGDPEAKCDAVISLYEALRHKRMRYGTAFELPTLGVLSMLPLPQDQIITQLAKVDTWLARHKGYGLFGLSKRQRLMHAALIVIADTMGHATALHHSISHSTLALAAAQQAALCTAIAAANAAAINAVS